ncbi:uncharacterized protein LOC131032809 [Cryptomeria japonica]|uniref:uncharacterized protein LOC131032809 n=1 Tax=Cryptomeria japonica TaxID=3369 RepID=UPI0027DAADAC|nr:uncharacterized protein LOC131032809 [Cryptomeria japonica]
MNRYQREEKPRPEVPIMDNEIHIATRGIPRNYITHAITLLTERGVSTVVLKALGNAISKAVTVAEIVKRKIPNLHHKITISSAPVTYTLELVEEGLLPLETTRHVSMITITLSTKQFDTSCTGYQPPLPADQVKPLPEYENEGDDSQVVLGKGRARGRAQGHGRGRSSGNAQYGNGSLYDNDKGAHGRSKSGYDGNYNDNGFRRGQGRAQGRFGGNDEDGGELTSRGRGHGRGRARGKVVGFNQM